MKKLDKKSEVQCDVQAPYRHENHAKPMSRRDLIAQGFINGTSYVMMPSILSILAGRESFAATVCGSSQSLPSMTPILIFDLNGGGNIAGSNVIVGKRGGQMDFLPNYGTLGLPDTMHPSISGQTNNEMGLVFHSDSAILRGIQSTSTLMTRSNVEGAVFCTASADDTLNNPHNPIYWIHKAGAKGQIVNLVNGGGRSLPPIKSIIKAALPVPINKNTDAINLVSPGKLATALSPLDVERVQVAMSKLTSAQLAKFDSLTMEDQTKTLIECGYIQAKELLISYTPEQVDPTKDPIVTGIFKNIAASGVENQVATIANMLVKGYAGGATIGLGGYDYHTNNRSVGETKDFSVGALIGQCLELAAQKKSDLMIYVFTDGGTVSNAVIDNSTAGRGKLSWASDSGQRASTFSLIYKHDGKPSIRQKDVRQIGAFNDKGGVDNQFLQTSNNVENLAKAIVANYLALHGKESSLASVVGDNPFGSYLENYLVFSKLR